MNNGQEKEINLDESTKTRNSKNSQLKKVDLNHCNRRTDQLYATNLNAFPIDGLSIHHDFITNYEMEEIIKLIDNEDGIEGKQIWTYAGFPKRRKQLYFFDSNFEKNRADDSEIGNEKGMETFEQFNVTPPKVKTQSQKTQFEKKIEWLLDRVHHKLRETSSTSTIYERPNVMMIEEFRGASPSGANVFEPTLGRELNGEKRCESYVAELTISDHTIQSFKKPMRRSNNCWDLQPGKNTKILLLKNSLLIKTEQSLYDWRCNNSSSLQHRKIKRNSAEANQGAQEQQYLDGLELPNGMGTLVRGKTYRCISIKMSFASSNFQETKAVPNDCVEDIPKYLPPLSNINTRTPLAKLLTIIVTTSPIKSNPSTEVLEKVFETFELAGHDFAYDCKKLIICDGIRLKEGGQANVTKKHSNDKQALRNGIANPQQAENYKKFKISLRQICDNADAHRNSSNSKSGKKSPFRNTTVVELNERYGYGFALREAVQSTHVCTPYVCVIQHDRTFMRKTPISEVVQSMIAQRDVIKYVGISMRSNLLLKDQFLGKYGKTSYEELEKMVIRPSLLNLSAEIYGKNGSSVSKMISSISKQKVRDNIISNQKTYFSCQQGLSHLNWLKKKNSLLEKQGNDESQKAQFSLTPTLFWYDNIHIVETAHYRDFIFNPKFKMVARGGFVEDKLSPVIMKSVERRGLVQGHRRFGCYILDDHSGMFFTGHLDGGSYLTAEQKNRIQNRAS